ncbi:glycosyltransferase family 4 protein [uncultured Barnesiella sp.]|uniref:glycosyltransferase family 4 protein n=1 Tax=uncultured Barnesiella sp. TaxID=584861 RepID=UPI0026346843|nr:glycosyltransferase family 4 protein [uncultured Barnesiella sp.]
MFSKKVRIGFISVNSPLDRKTSSGTTFQMYQALKKIGADIVWLQPKHDFFYKLVNLFFKLLAVFTRSRILRDHIVPLAKIESKSLKKIYIEQCDILFAPFASTALYYLKTDKPIIYLSDATFAAMLDYYFKGIAFWNIKQANKIEQTALSKATIIVVSSEWARQSVQSDYNIPQPQIHVLEFGANIDEEDIVPHKFIYNNHLNILFLGVDWIRKGGEIAVEAVKYLNENGIFTTLQIVGIRNLDNDIANLPYVKNYGFFDKNNPDDYNQLVSIIQQSHCLLLPTKAECAGIVFCESSANGLPIFTYNTGGVANYVENGRNGYMLSLGATGKDFGQKIRECLDSGELEKMSEFAVSMYKEKLNWQVWGQKVEKIIDSILQ